MTGAPCLTLQGFCGDVNPKQHRAGYEAAQKLGTELGGLLVASIRTAPSVSVTPLRADGVELALPLEAPLSAADLDTFKRQQDAWLAETKAQGGDIRPPTCCLQYAQQLSTDPPAEVVSFRVHTIRIGDIAIVGAEGELFCQYQHNLEWLSPAQFTLACGYAQGCIGYVPTAAEFARGG